MADMKQNGTRICDGLELYLDERGAVTSFSDARPYRHMLLTGYELICYPLTSADVDGVMAQVIGLMFSQTPVTPGIIDALRDHARNTEHWYAVYEAFCESSRRLMEDLEVRYRDNPDSMENFRQSDSVLKGVAIERVMSEAAKPVLTNPVAAARESDLAELKEKRGAAGTQTEKQAVPNGKKLLR